MVLKAAPVPPAERMRRVALLLPLLLAGVAGAGPPPCTLHGPLPDGRLGFQVSDGRELLSAVWEPRRGGLSGCRISTERPAVAAFLSRCRAERREEKPPPAFPGLAEAKTDCWGASAPRRRAKRGFTYPGTLWCGAGNAAESYEQLGEHQETDKCCREHDHCQHVIHPFTYRYGYRNFRWHTISHCDCDERLKACLRAVNDTASRVVGQAFFNVIQVPCFTFAYKEQCVEPYLYVWCRNYSTVTVAVAQRPIQYEYGGEVIDRPVTRRVPALSLSTPAAPTSRSPFLRTPAAPPRKPGQDVPGATTTPGPRVRPSRLPKKQRKGKGKGKKGKGKKGKGLKKKKAGAKASGSVLAHPGRAEAAASPKLLATPDVDKGNFQDLAPRPGLGDEDPFNAVLSDDPAGGTALVSDADSARTESRELEAPKTPPGPPAPAEPPRRGRGAKRQRLQQGERPQGPGAG
uniref:phospholipase A2 n=1 Tax=Salvator merianae TaxID=96440 RepID=A0A8D0DNG0_SALMN